MVEVGVDVIIEGEKKIAPIGEKLWQARMEARRSQELEASLLEVEAVLAEIKEMNRSGVLDRQAGSRRAVVFYVDKG